jgi:hypothetical protein
MSLPHPFLSLRRLRAGLIVVSIASCDGRPASDAPGATVASVQAAPSTESTPASGATAAADTNTIVVYKSPTCGCCAKWVEHLQSAGFHVVVHDTEDVDAVKDGSGVPAQLRGCHTAIAGRYVIEGHVPASDIRQLLRQRPAIAGLAVPGMPSGSPGMEGGSSERYDVLTFGGSGPARVFASH